MKKNTKGRRGKNLADQDIAAIVGILDGWRGKLTWELLLEAVQSRLLGSYTRQALNNHVRIADAFRDRKLALSQELGSGPRKRLENLSPELQAALERIERLEMQCTRLQKENDRLLEQFARWVYNAETRGLDREFLNRPLPSVNREPTKLASIGGRTAQ